MFWKLQENVVSDLDIDLLVSFIRKAKRFTQFSMVREFEEAFAVWQGCTYCVFVNSGSSANLILIDALKELRKWRSGDEIIVPAVTWPTTINPVIQCGLNPIFSDVNLNDLSFDYDQIESKITSRTRGIFVVHLLGIPANIQRLNKIVNGRDIVIIEDCCESHGATINGVKVGNFGAGGTFSFYWGHHMTTVEGGIVCTEDERLRDLFLLKRSHGLARELPQEKHHQYKNQNKDIDFNFLFLSHGYNFRNTEFNAVLGVSQLKNLNNYIQKRNDNYKKFLKVIAPIQEKLYEINLDGLSSFCLPFIFMERKHKLKLQAALNENGIEFRPIIGGNLLRQPCYKNYGNYKEFVCAEIIHENGFYIGNNQFVNDERLNILSHLIQKVFK